MRTKVVVGACGLAVLILAPAIYYRFAPSAPAHPAPAPASPQAVAAAVAAPAQPVHHRRIMPANNGEGVAVSDPGKGGHEAYVTERQAELTELGMSDDPDNLKTILAELNNKDGRIRQSALDAAVQFGSKDAIPALQNEMAWTEDPQEKVNIQNAIKYLELPSFQEFTASVNSGAAAQH